MSFAIGGVYSLREHADQQQVDSVDRKNVGPLDGWIRLAAGLTLISLGASGRLGRKVGFFGTLLGATVVASGVSRFSPLYDLLGISSNSRTGEFSLTQQPTPDVSASPLPRDFPWEKDQREDSPGEQPSESSVRRPATTRYI